MSKRRQRHRTNTEIRGFRACRRLEQAVLAVEDLSAQIQDGASTFRRQPPAAEGDPDRVAAVESLLAARGRLDRRATKLVAHAPGEPATANLLDRLAGARANATQLVEELIAQPELRRG